MRSTFNITTINETSTSKLKGWYDNPTDSDSQLWYTYYLFFSVSGLQKFILIKPYTFKQESLINYRIPFLTKDIIFPEIDFYVQARDVYGGISGDLISYNVSNIYYSDETTRVTTLLDLHKTYLDHPNIFLSTLANDT